MCQCSHTGPSQEASPRWLKQHKWPLQKSIPQKRGSGVSVIPLQDSSVTIHRKEMSPMYNTIDISPYFRGHGIREFHVASYFLTVKLGVCALVNTVLLHVGNTNKLLQIARDMPQRPYNIILLTKEIKQKYTSCLIYFPEFLPFYFLQVHRLACAFVGFWVLKMLYSCIQTETL